VETGLKGLNVTLYSTFFLFWQSSPFSQGVTQYRSVQTSPPEISNHVERVQKFIKYTSVIGVSESRGAAAVS